MDIVTRLLWGWDARAHAPDQLGRVFVVTGANSGIGFEVALRLAERRATVVMGARDLAAGKRAAEAILSRAPGARLAVSRVDLASAASVRAFAARVAAAFPGGVHCLANVAGALNPPPARGGGGAALTGDGFEITRAVNFFGPALLTHLLLPSLAAAAPARVVNVCSVGEAAGRLRWGPDLRGAGPGAPRADFWAYADAKLCLLVWGRELHRRLRGAGVDVLSVHPGVVHTPGEWKASGRRLSSWLTWLGALVHGQSVRWGATSTLFAATEPRLAGRGGAYIGPRYLQLFGYAGSNTAERAPLNAAARDPATGARLFGETTAALLSALGGGDAAAALPQPDQLAAAAVVAAVGGGASAGAAAAAAAPAKGFPDAAAGAPAGDAAALAAAIEEAEEAEAAAEEALEEGLALVAAAALGEIVGEAAVAAAAAAAAAGGAAGGVEPAEDVAAFSLRRGDAEIAAGGEEEGEAEPLLPADEPLAP